MGNFFLNTKFLKMLSDVCFDLSLWWHLPNWVIAFKMVKIVKLPKKMLAHSILFLQHILTRYKCVVHSCLHLFTIMYKHCILWIPFYGWYDTFTLFWVYFNSYCIAQMYYICPGPVFQCEFNCGVCLLIKLTCFSNFYH